MSRKTWIQRIPTVIPLGIAATGVTVVGLGLAIPVLPTDSIRFQHMHAEMVDATGHIFFDTDPTGGPTAFVRFGIRFSLLNATVMDLYTETDRLDITAPVQVNQYVIVREDEEFADLSVVGTHPVLTVQPVFSTAVSNNDGLAAHNLTINTFAIIEVRTA